MKRVFLSFKMEDKPQVNGLRLLAANPSFEIEFYDESVRTEIKSHDATYIRSKIRDKINRTSVTVCLLSSDTHKSNWVNWELEESIDKGNDIIGMGLPNGPSRIILPAAMKRLDLTWHLWDLGRLKRLIG